jgi:hypothetical protein
MNILSACSLYNPGFDQTREMNHLSSDTNQNFKFPAGMS